MADFNEKGKESMRVLTNKIISADLAAKKHKIHTIKGRLLFNKWFYFPMSAYALYVKTILKL